MLKALKAFFFGLISIVMGILWVAQPGTQGAGGGIALILVGLFLILRGLKLLTGAGSMRVGMGSSSRPGSGQTTKNLFSRRRVISPQDSRPEIPFKM